MSPLGCPLPRGLDPRWSKPRKSQGFFSLGGTPTSFGMAPPCSSCCAGKPRISRNFVIYHWICPDSWDDMYILCAHSLSLSLFIYIHTYIYIFVYIYICIDDPKYSMIGLSILKSPLQEHLQKSSFTNMSDTWRVTYMFHRPTSVSHSLRTCTHNYSQVSKTGYAMPHTSPKHRPFEG